MRSALPRRVVVLATAVAGVVVGHAAAYAVAFPNGAARASELHATGHGYWGSAVLLGAAAAAVAFGAVGWRAARREDIGIGFAPLAAGQVTLFATAEVTERLAAGVPLTALARAPEFAVGVVLQLLVAALAIVVLRRWGRLVAAIAAPRTRSIVDPALLPLASPVPAPLMSRAQGTTRTRGPPTFALA